MSTEAVPANPYYTSPIPQDFRQGDIYEDVLHVMVSDATPTVVRTRQAGGGRTQAFLHNNSNPPRDGFHWNVKERTVVDGQLGHAIVLTHDCEIENSDNKEHRLVGLLRPMSNLSPEDQHILLENRHFGRFYLPAWGPARLVDSYVDFRRITTVRYAGLPEDRRVVSLTDEARRNLQAAIVRYLTELYRA